MVGQVLNQRLTSARGLRTDQDPTVEFTDKTLEPAGRVRGTTIHRDIRHNVGLAIAAAGGLSGFRGHCYPGKPFE